METCVACGASIASVERLPSHDDDAFGIPVTIRNAVFRHRCADCGMDGIEIPDSEDLEAAIAVARILVPVSLSGVEIRFLRKACGMTGKEFAEAINVDNATLCRWEKAAGFGEGHGELSDRNIRDTVWSLLYRQVPAIHVEPGHFKRMPLLRLPEGEPLPRLVLERVRLKDPVRHTKSDEWDIFGQAA